MVGNGENDVLEVDDGEGDDSGLVMGVPEGAAGVVAPTVIVCVLLQPLFPV